MFKALTALAVLQSLLGPAMSQHQCDMSKLAREYVEKRFPFFDPSGLKAIISESENMWEFTYELPRGVLGGVPIITIDKRSCLVVRAEHSQ